MTIPILNALDPMLAIVDCAGCNGTGEIRIGFDPDWCDCCGGSGADYVDITWMRNLATSLAWAGFGAAMRSSGYAEGYDAGHRARDEELRKEGR